MSCASIPEQATIKSLNLASWDNVLSFLAPADLMRVRKVSKGTKAQVGVYISAAGREEVRKVIDGIVMLEQVARGAPLPSDKAGRAALMREEVRTLINPTDLKRVIAQLPRKELEILKYHKAYEEVVNEEMRRRNIELIKTQKFLMITNGVLGLTLAACILKNMPKSPPTPKISMAQHNFFLVSLYLGLSLLISAALTLILAFYLAKIGRVHKFIEASDEKSLIIRNRRFNSEKLILCGSLIIPPLSFMILNFMLGVATSAKENVKIFIGRTTVVPALIIMATNMLTSAILHSIALYFGLYKETRPELMNFSSTTDVSSPVTLAFQTMLDNMTPKQRRAALANIHDLEITTRLFPQATVPLPWTGAAAHLEDRDTAAERVV